MLEKFHHYRFCPQCRVPVLQSHRFCTNCFVWLGRPGGASIRALDEEQGVHAKGAEGVFSRFHLRVKVFQVGLQYIIVGLGLGIMIALLLVYYLRALMPTWFSGHGTAMYQQTCYANMRSIQTTLETYLLEKKFTPGLASDPVKVLFDAGYLQEHPRCPLHGNNYKIIRGSSLQCVGSNSHGLP